VNFLGGDEDPDRVREAYGESVYDRLVDVKTTYDPDNVFHHNQNIRPGTGTRISGASKACPHSRTEVGRVPQNPLRALAGRDFGRRRRRRGRVHSAGRSVKERPYRDLYTLRLLHLLTAGCGTPRTWGDVRLESEKRCTADMETRLTSRP